MPIEQVGYISSLDPLSPYSAESPTGIDDHARLIKRALQNTFPNLDGEVTLTPDEFNDLLDNVAACVLKAGDTMTGDLVITGYKSLGFAVGEETNVFAKLTGSDDTLTIGVYDETGLLQSIVLSPDGVTFSSTLNGVTPDGETASELTTVEYVDNRNRITILRGTKASGVDAGDFISGSWRVREIDDAPFVNDIGVTVDSNQITIPEGLYLIEGSAPAHGVNGHVVAWQNVLAGTYVRGPNEFAAPEGDSRARINLKQEVTADDVTNGNNVFELRHIASIDNVDDGLGSASGLGTEVYAEVILRAI